MSTPTSGLIAKTCQDYVQVIPCNTTGEAYFLPPSTNKSTHVTTQMKRSHAFHQVFRWVILNWPKRRVGIPHFQTKLTHTQIQCFNA